MKLSIYICIYVDIYIVRGGAFVCLCYVEVAGVDDDTNHFLVGLEAYIL